MVDGASPRAKALVGATAYVASGVRHLRDGELRVRLRVDGGPWQRRRARGVVVANVGTLGRHVRLAAAAQPDDGALDVLVLTPRSVRQWVQLAVGVVLRRPRPPHLETVRARAVEVATSRPRARQADGEDIGPGDVLRARVRPGALTLCVPPSQASGPRAVEDLR